MEHAVLALTAEYFPVAQLVHDAAPALEYCPLPQLVHSKDCANGYIPAGHD